MVLKLLSKKKPVVEQPIVQEVQEVEQTVPTLPVKQVVKQQPKEVWKVVYQLPTQEVRQRVREDGVIENYITVEEYLTHEANDGLE